MPPIPTAAALSARVSICVHPELAARLDGTVDAARRGAYVDVALDR